MSKQFVSVEEVRQLVSRLREINREPLENICWTENGRVLNIAPEAVEDWAFTGLSNVDFILTGKFGDVNETSPQPRETEKGIG